MAAPQHDNGARSVLRLVFLCNNALFPMRAPVTIAFTLSVARTLSNWRLVNLYSVTTHGHIPSIQYTLSLHVLELSMFTPQFAEHLLPQAHNRQSPAKQLPHFFYCKKSICYKIHTNKTM